MARLIVGIALMAAFANGGHVCGDTIFFRLGDLPGGGNYSNARAVSGDGHVVVGSSDSAIGHSEEAYRWTRNGGLFGLGDPLTHYSSSIAYGASRDGSVIVGMQHYAGEGQRAFRWTEGRGMVNLGVLDPTLPGATSHGLGVSGDGSVVVGNSSSWAVPNADRAFRWTESNGMKSLGVMSGGTRSVAQGVSADGSVAVGWGDSANGDYEAFRWTEIDGMVGIGDLSGGIFQSSALAISADGTTIVGHGISDSVSVAFRWTASDGMTPLSFLGDTVGSTGWSVSGDGSVVVGSRGDSAFIWDSVNGIRNLQDLLINEYGQGNALAGWRLGTAYGISADGRTIVGSGVNPDGNGEGWMVQLPGAVVPAPSSLTCLVGIGVILGGIEWWKNRRKRVKMTN